MIAKRLNEALAARNKLYEASQQHHLEVCDMKRQIRSLEEEKIKASRGKFQASEAIAVCPSL